MGTFLAWIIALASFALFIAALTLVCLNWSAKTITPVASILLVGIATTLVTVGIPLKESSISSQTPSCRLNRGKLRMVGN